MRRKWVKMREKKSHLPHTHPLAHEKKKKKKKRALNLVLFQFIQASGSNVSDEKLQVAEEVAKRVVDDIFEAMWARRGELLSLRMSQLEEESGFEDGS